MCPGSNRSGPALQMLTRRHLHLRLHEDVYTALSWLLQAFVWEGWFGQSMNRKHEVLEGWKAGGKGRPGGVLKGAAAAQEEVADKEERKRDAKADLEKIEELMGQRRESLGSLARPGWTYHHNNDSALDLELEWQEEEKSIRAVLDKVLSPSSGSPPSQLPPLPSSLPAFSSLRFGWEFCAICGPLLKGFGHGSAGPSLLQRIPLECWACHRMLHHPVQSRRAEKPAAFCRSIARTPVLEVFLYISISLPPQNPFTLSRMHAHIRTHTRTHTHARSWAHAGLSLSPPCSIPRPLLPTHRDPSVHNTHARTRRISQASWSGLGEFTQRRDICGLKFTGCLFQPQGRPAQPKLNPPLL